MLGEVQCNQFGPSLKEMALIESMCSELRHSLNITIPTLVCPRMPMEAESLSICDANRGHQCLCLCEGGKLCCQLVCQVLHFTALVYSDKNDHSVSVQ